MFRFALRFALYDRAKSIGVILGIVVSTFLVGQQVGIFLFLTGSMSSLVDNTEADIWVIDSRTTDANALGAIDVRIGRQAESVPGVAAVYPLIVSGGRARFEGGKSSPVTVVGSQPPAFRGGPWKIQYGDLSELVEESAVAIDHYDRGELNDATVGTRFEIGGRTVRVAVQTKGVRSFGGIYVFSTLETARVVTRFPLNDVSAFLIDVEEGADPVAVRDRLNATLPNVRAWTKRGLSETTVDTILSSSGIAYSIGTLVVFAFIAGMVIIGLTMYSAAVDRTRDYGTLKAIGAKNGYIRNLILVQALAFALIGYGVGVALVELFRNAIASSGVIYDYGTTFRIVFFLLTLAIALGGAVFAMRRIASLEPASVFKN
ncbi:MAG: FtsX-like permease family protein [Candidatus Eisenbacteria bacterium]|nr:FtsX-like permease family protein [Candidatus Eisenbacteria bacterium]